MSTVVHSLTFLDRLIAVEDCITDGLVQKHHSFQAMWRYFLLVSIRFTVKLKGKNYSIKNLMILYFKIKSRGNKDPSLLNRWKENIFLRMSRGSARWPITRVSLASKTFLEILALTVLHLQYGVKNQFSGICFPMFRFLEDLQLMVHGP